MRIEADNGLVGWGEATVAPTMTGDTLPGIVAAVRKHMAPLLIGADARDRAVLAQPLPRTASSTMAAPRPRSKSRCSISSASISACLAST